MDDRGPSTTRPRRQATRVPRSSTRRGFVFSRPDHRLTGHGTQARRENRQGFYIIGFVVVVLALAAFLYVGLSWATGPGRVAALGSAPTLTPEPTVAVEPTEAAAAAPTAQASEANIYTVKAGDNPASIAAQFKIRTEDLIAANRIADPQRLQIGQQLKIPTPAPAQTPGPGQTPAASPSPAR